jgi:hypothetical protein
VSHARKVKKVMAAVVEPELKALGEGAVPVYLAEAIVE